MSRTIGRFACAAALLLVLPLSAQECERGENVSQCMSRFIPAVSNDTTPEAEETRTEDATETAATGITNTASPAESSLKDFLTLLSASLESATSAEEGQAFTFDWNPELAIAQNWGVKFQASFADATLNDEVKTRLAGGEALDELQDSLEFGDDTALRGFLQPQNRRFGRSIESHRGWFRAMRNAVLEPRREELRRIRMLMAKHQMIGNQTFETDRMGEPLKDDDRPIVEARIAEFSALGRELQAARELQSAFFMAFAKLLNNQPQVYGAAIYHARRNVVGPNEWSGKFTYEFAGNNLNAFRKAHAKCLTLKTDQPTAAEVQLSTECADLVTKFANATRPGIERVAVSLEYHKANRRWIDDPAAGLQFGFPRRRSFVGTIAFGTTTAPVLPFRTEVSGVGDARFDFTAKYELPEDDQSEAKGFVGTLTYTQKISDTFSLPLSFVYSDHESDLLNVQKRFSARFGLMYKLPDFK